MILYLKSLIWLLITVFFHEVGHYRIAKQQGIYKGWGFKAGSVCIKIEHRFESRWDYLSGLVYGFLVMPLGFFFGIEFWVMIFVQYALAAGDFWIIAFYNKVK